MASTPGRASTSRSSFAVTLLLVTCLSRRSCSGGGEGEQLDRRAVEERSKGKASYIHSDFDGSIWHGKVASIDGVETLFRTACVVL